MQPKGGGSRFYVSKGGRVGGQVSRDAVSVASSLVGKSGVVCLRFCGLQTGVREDRPQMGTPARKLDGRDVPGTHLGLPVGKGLLTVFLFVLFFFLSAG